MPRSSPLLLWRRGEGLPAEGSANVGRGGRFSSPSPHRLRTAANAYERQITPTLLWPIWPVSGLPFGPVWLASHQFGPFRGSPSLQSDSRLTNSDLLGVIRSVSGRFFSAQNPSQSERQPLR